jgi:hypothetical protein
MATLMAMRVQDNFSFMSSPSLCQHGPQIDFGGLRTDDPCNDQVGWIDLVRYRSHTHEESAFSAAGGASTAFVSGLRADVFWFC